MQKQTRIDLNLLLISLSALTVLMLLAGCRPQAALTFQQPKLVIKPENIGEEQDEREEIAAAFEDAIAGREDVLSFLIFNVLIDHIDLSENKDTALVWYSLADPESGEVLSTEAGLAIAHRSLSGASTGTQDGDNDAWNIVLQADPDWEEHLSKMPEALLDPEIRSRYTLKEQDIPHARQIFGGYRLPWEPGESKYLTGSIGHVYIYKTCPSTCLYAFDFGDGTMWPVLAAKAGRVRYAVWHHPNGNTKHANFIVLEDSTTNPTTYQVYMHLAQDSIPVELRKPGAVVVQGQKIGVVDDTGVSTGHHLHFHVHTNPGSFWGTSVDITFDEVKTNSGRPRTCYESRLYPALGSQCQTGNLYVSDNNDLYAPSGDITSPEDNSVISSQMMRVKGWAEDDTGIQSVQVIVNYSGEWLPVGKPAASENFEAEIDLCEPGIPDSPFFTALKITDTAGKEAPGLPGLRTVTRRFTCPLPPPECEINENQIGIFALPQYQGPCQLLDIGTAARDEITAMPASSIGSIQLGENAIARFSLAQREIPLINSVLDTTQIIPDIDDLEKISIEQKPPQPYAPTLIIDGFKSEPGSTASGGVLISWEYGDPSFTYRVQIAQGDRLIRQRSWAAETHWEVNDLPPGEYKLYLDVHNIIGDASTTAVFSVEAAPASPSTTLLPLPDTIGATMFRIAWLTDKDQNNLRTIDIRYRENGGDWKIFKEGLHPQTSHVWFSGNPGAVYEFQIRGTDMTGNMETFHSSPGSTVKILANCTPDQYDLRSKGDDSPKQSAVIELDDPQKHNICGHGDSDWMAFVAEKGSIYRITAQARSESTAILLNLYDLNNTSALYSAQPEEPGMGSQIVWVAPANGIFYLEAKASDPLLFGTETKYQIEVKKVVQVNSSGILAAVIVPLLWAFLRFSKKTLADFTRKKNGTLSALC